MNKAKHLLRNKFSLVTILSLGFLVLGIVCISWALINIGAQSVYSADAFSSPTTFAVKQARLTGDDGAPTEPGDASGIFNPDKILYPLYPSEGDNIGSLSIPVLKQKLPILQGTGTDELKKGVGHFIQSALPGEEGNSVLSGHRDTVFSKLGKLKIDDQLIVQTSAGTFTYEIKRIRIVDKDDKTVIVPADHAILTLTTCYPFRFFGSAPDRYILTADLVISK
ncbi:MAG: class D sortase [Candidatus Humimicrobiaceae bacterium]